MKVQGGCHCGNITYEADINPDAVGICHCTDCQTGSGSAYRVNVRCAEGSFKLLSGQPKIYVKTTADSGNPRAQGFCPECGTPLFSTTVTDQKVHVLRVGSIKQRAQLRPSAMGWCRSMQPWVTDLSGLERSEKQRA